MGNERGNNPGVVLGPEDAPNKTRRKTLGKKDDVNEPTSGERNNTNCE